MIDSCSYVSFFSFHENVGEERELQKSYWIEHSSDLTVEAMMLDSNASDLDKEERPEVHRHHHLSVSLVSELLFYEIRMQFCLYLGVPGFQRKKRSDLCFYAL